VVLADAGRGDWILCQVTSNPYGDARAIKIEDASFAVGGLRVTSFARPGKLFTANEDLINHKAGALKPEGLAIIVDLIVRILRGR
jgi:mRNA interferase MazF